MAEQHQCTGGEHPTNAPGITLCHTCTDKLRGLLRDVPDVWANLAVTAARLDVGTSTLGTTGHSTPSEPCNFDALENADQLAAVLQGWLDHMQPTKKTQTPAATAANLFTLMPQIRTQDWAGDLMRELRESLNACRRATDRTTERITLGPCMHTECPGTLTARLGDHTGKCDWCRSPFNVKAYQLWLISESWHVATFLPRIIRALKAGGHAKVNTSKVDQWVYRGKLEPVACDVGSKRSLYTAADVLRVYLETPTGKREVSTPEQMGMVA
ncbi:hypothetical protein [Pseudarthrobacter sp. PS3-L1]|uniref:hypothetical protein n=1 Tax=Pseudarthrobacter sp. PS3-L1 TaxID=3046207 RepID=UPI0024B98BBF|nr:hypothetical protein [Pseudarthrobacter sp. PS3-L1]MDJ0321843.1 hypothetical protein [Pseudarthrobacter sp. PS3-L1]